MHHGHGAHAGALHADQQGRGIWHMAANGRVAANVVVNVPLPLVLIDPSDLLLQAQG